MISFDSESSLWRHELTVHMQAPVERYMKDNDSWRSEDAKESPRVEREVVAEVEAESEEEQDLIYRLSQLKGAG